MIDIILNWYIYALLIYSFFQEKNPSLPITANIVSLTHAIFTIIFSLKIILNDDFYSDQYDYSKSLIIQISASYFIYDSVLMFLTNFSMMFFFHHLLILIVYYTSFTYNCGAKLVIYTLFWGEITNPLQISWFLSRYLNYKKIENYLFSVFSFNFILVRSVILPYTHYILINNMDTNNYSNYIFTILSILGNIGSLLWVKNIIKKLIK